MHTAESMTVIGKRRRRIAARIVGLCVLAATTHPAVGQDCHIGSYLMTDGSVLDIAPSEGETLRWRRFDGTTGALHKTAAGEWKSTYGWTGRPDGKSASFSDCDSGSLNFDGVRGERIVFKVRNTVFSSHDTNLAGRLVMPPGESKVSVVVLLHGSEQDSALDTYSLQRMLPAHGVGAFVYDKRGTGRSAGTYTQDFTLLAEDAVAAMREARRLAGAPWYKDLHGNYTYMLLPYSETQLRQLGDSQLSWTRTTPFHYDPMPVLRAGTVPQLWIVGGEDYEAPSAETSRRLKELIAAGHPFTLARYPDAEHGMTLFEVTADGSRDSTRYAPGYFAMIRDFARDGRLSGSYGNAEVTMPRERNRPQSH